MEGFPSSLIVPVTPNTALVAVVKSKVALLPVASTVSVPATVASSNFITFPPLTVKLLEAFTVNKFSTTISLLPDVLTVPAIIKL